MNTQPNPIGSLLSHHEVQVALVDVIASTIGLLATRYLSPGDTDFVLKIVALYQPLILLVIGALFTKDNAATHAAAIVEAAQIAAAPAPAPSASFTSSNVPVNLRAPH